MRRSWEMWMASTATCCCTTWVNPWATPPRTTAARPRPDGGMIWPRPRMPHGQRVGRSRPSGGRLRCGASRTRPLTCTTAGRVPSTKPSGSTGARPPRRPLGTRGSPGLTATTCSRSSNRSRPRRSRGSRPPLPPGGRPAGRNCRHHVKTARMVWKSRGRAERIVRGPGSGTRRGGGVRTDVPGASARGRVIEAPHRQRHRDEGPR